MDKLWPYVKEHGALIISWLALAVSLTTNLLLYRNSRVDRRRTQVEATQVEAKLETIQIAPTPEESRTLYIGGTHGPGGGRDE